MIEQTRRVQNANRRLARNWENRHPACFLNAQAGCISSQCGAPSCLPRKRLSWRQSRLSHPKAFRLLCTMSLSDPKAILLLRTMRLYHPKGVRLLRTMRLSDPKGVGRTVSVSRRSLLRMHRALVFAAHRDGSPYLASHGPYATRDHQVSSFNLHPSHHSLPRSVVELTVRMRSSS